MCEADDIAALEEELSNVLNHLYRMGELCKKRLGTPAYLSALQTSPDLRAARAAIWARTFDVHEAVVTASSEDLYSQFYTNFYGVLAWKPLASLPRQTDKHGRHVDYQQELEGRPVLDSMHRAFSALERLLP